MRVKVSVSDVDLLKKSVESAREDSMAAGSSFIYEVESSYSRLDHARTVSYGFAREAQEKLDKVNDEIDKLESEKAALEAELAVTPPTITVTCTDEDGNTYTEEIPNPRYAELESEIADVESKLGPLHEESSRLQRKIDENIANAKKAESLMERCRGLNSTVSNKLSSIDNESSMVSRKLNQVIEAIERYKFIKMKTPGKHTVSDPRLR